MAKLEPYRGDYYLWEYLPSKPAAVIFLLLFLAATLFHTWKAWKTRAKFCIPFCIGGLFEIVGYGARGACTDRTAQLMPYVIQNIFILLGPIFFAASIYMFLARLIRSVGAEKHSLIRVNWMTKTFVAGDIASFLVQGNGAGMMAIDRMADIAKAIVITGLMIQIVVFGFFMLTSIVFEKRMRRAPTAHEGSWRRHLYPLYAVSVLIMVRSIFRVIEYAMGNKGYLLSHEWPMYVFDSVLMLGVMGIWGWWHPGIVRQETDGAQLLSMGSMESKA
ncbi:RTA1 like protein-domain-containing protein [Aspergillus cavernicola]|uniref:RTA1 like protein-domain-containing protein n=1 Tax=Aspergillus cavernicola TaxID=176166 RepID=A0ABR4HL24_9EURO